MIQGKTSESTSKTNSNLNHEIISKPVNLKEYPKITRKNLFWIIGLRGSYMEPRDFV